MRDRNKRTSTPFFRCFNGSELVVGIGSSQQWSCGSVNLPIETEREEFASSFTRPLSPQLYEGATLQHYPRVAPHADILSFQKPAVDQSPLYHQVADDKAVVYPPSFDSPSSPVQPTQAEVDVMMNDSCLLDIDDALRLTMKGEMLECYKVPEDGHKVNTLVFVCNVINHSFV